MKLQTSGLYDRVSAIYVGVVGTESLDFLKVYSKLYVIYHSANILTYERLTLEALRKYCDENEGCVFYIHTKGVSVVQQCVADWRHLMEHFVIGRWTECIAALKTSDTCGVNWLMHPSPHYSGNFWWATCDYIRTLPSSPNPVLGWTEPARTACEAWIGCNGQIRSAELHNSNVNHYLQRYPRTKYAALGEVDATFMQDAPSAWRGLENRFQDLIEPIGTIKTIVQVGVDYAFSLLCFALAAPKATIIGIDQYGGNADCALTEDRIATAEFPCCLEGMGAFQWTRRKIAEFENVILLTLTSCEASSIFLGNIDVLHLNGNHQFENVVQDFSMWSPKVRPGGCILFHNTVSHANDVGRFFAELRGAKAHIQECNGLGAWYKPQV